MNARVLRVRHAVFGLGWWQRLTGDGRAWVAFDGAEAHIGGDRCVLIRDLAPETLRESAARTDAAVADMMGRDPRAVVAALREQAS